MIDFAKLETLGPLKEGKHSGPTEGACVMEAISYIAGEPWSDHPECVSLVIGAFLRSWNDNLPTDADRDRLMKPLIPKIINTRSTLVVEKQRSYLALDWLIRSFLPAWLRLAKLYDHADKVETLVPIVDMVTAKAAAPVTSAAAEAAAWTAAWDAEMEAAWTAAWDTAWEAAMGATWTAAWDAERHAAGTAAVDAACHAAWVAAWGAPRDAVVDAVIVAAREAARDAARAAAWEAAWEAARHAAGAAARHAAVNALSATRDQLQLSAIDLIERMAALEKKERT
ncbi:hypothetical protein EBZ38_07380 [bacterium]|nr:hypothetical protein [bacterium]